MHNNDILRRIRYIFDFGDDQMMKIFYAAGTHVTREQVCNWLKKDDQPTFQKLKDGDLATFLNGLINVKRGKKEGPQPIAEKALSNNGVLRKLKIALSLQSEDMLAIMGLGGQTLSKHELSAFFRKPGHKHYRQCRDQVLRNFLSGLSKKYRSS